MTVIKRKKSRKKRGNYNRVGFRRRGSGNRGGVGRAGMGKKRGHKRLSLIKELKQGKRVKLLKRKKGFKRPKPVVIKLNTINVGDIDKSKKEVVLKGFKVLGKGIFNAKITISASQFSEKAKQKITSAGGKFIEI